MENLGTKKLIIRCPNCEEKGIKQSLAEILPTGIVSIQRIRKGLNNHVDHTLIVGTKFSLVCGNCGETVFIRKK